MDLGHQRAGGVDGLELTVGGLAVDRRRDAVGGEHDRRADRHLVELLDEDRAALLEVRHHVLVVDDLLADVDGSAVQIERLLDRHDRAVDPGAVAPRVGQQHLPVGVVRPQNARMAEVDRHTPSLRSVRSGPKSATRLISGPPKGAEPAHLEMSRLGKVQQIRPCRRSPTRHPAGRLVAQQVEGAVEGVQTTIRTDNETSVGTLWLDNTRS